MAEQAARRASFWLDKAIKAEARVEELEARVGDLTSRLKAALGADPATAIQALSWVTRAEQGEALVAQIVRYLDQRSLASTDLPDGWEASARALLKALEVLKRDQGEIFERPDDSGAYWTTNVDSLGRRGIVKDEDGWMHRAR